jgi:hypothetical protein
MLKKISFALSIALLVLTACAPTQPASTVTQPPPTATSAPKVLASTVEDVVGVWRAPGEGGVMILEFKMDGTFSAKDTGGREYDSGKFWFEDTHLIFDSVAGSGSHEVYVTKREDKPVRLELCLINDPCEIRVKTITNRTLFLVEP